VFQDWLEGLILRREAEQLIGIRQAAQEPPQPAATEAEPAESEIETAIPEKPDEEGTEAVAQGEEAADSEEPETGP
jgi:hypothetical protein